MGNRIKHTRTGVAPETLEPLHHNEANQLVQRGKTYYEYDANGHLIRKESPGEVREYFYDAQERLIRVKDGSGHIVVSYGYNPFGHRMWKEVDGHRTYFFYNHSGLVGEYDTSANLIREYHYKPGQTWMTRPQFMRVDKQVYYYHNDHLGTPQKIIARNGSVVWEAHYGAFGKAKVRNATITNHLRFPGQYWDAETELHHNYFRDYDPLLGRYLQSDPIGLEGGANIYAYVNGNPINYVDIDGLRSLPQNPWNRFQHFMRGRNLTSRQMSQIYNQIHLQRLANFRNQGLHNALGELPDRNEEAFKAAFREKTIRDINQQSALSTLDCTDNGACVITLRECDCFGFENANNFCPVARGPKLRPRASEDSNCFCWNQRYSVNL